MPEAEETWESLCEVPDGQFDPSDALAAWRFLLALVVAVIVVAALVMGG